MSGPETLKGFFSACIFASSKNSVRQSNFFSELVWRACIPAHQLKHSDITLIEKCKNRSRISVFLLWRPTLHTTAHTIFQLLTYSCNVQRAVQVKVRKEKRARQSTFSVRHNTT